MLRVSSTFNFKKIHNHCVNFLLSSFKQTQTVPKLIQFFQDSLSVDRVQENLLFER